MTIVRDVLRELVRDQGEAPLSYSQAVIADGASVTVQNSAGSKTVTGTIDVVDGELSKVIHAANAAIVTNTMALTGVTPSGSYTNTVTFTVANGVITAIVLS